MVRDMTGEAQGGCLMRGVRDAGELQQLILAEVGRVNNVAALAPAEPVKVTPPAADSGAMLELLRKIEVNTRS